MGVTSTVDRAPALRRPVLSNQVSKLGPCVFSFSLPRVVTCPGRSEWCSKRCYMAGIERIRPSVLAGYRNNLRWAKERPADLERCLTGLLIASPGAVAVRMHVDGDFFSAAYVRMWARIAAVFPGIPFYAYTRAWRVKRLRRALAELREVGNVVLFASVDSSTEDPPPGWRAAWLDSDERARGPACPHDSGEVPNCSVCRLCFDSAERNVTFRER